MSNYSPFKEIRTKVVGVTMGDDADTRQAAIKAIGESFDEDERWFLDLVPEPDNPYDKFAVRVMTNVPGMGRVQLGYVGNAEVKCGFCSKEYPSWPKRNGVALDGCPNCSSDNLQRNGLATQLCKLMAADPTANYFGEILSITGGTEEKPTAGCNFAIRRAHKPKSK